MVRARTFVRDEREAMSRLYWRLVEFIAGSVERSAIEAVHRELQRRGLTPPGVRLRAEMYADGRLYGDPP